MFLYVKGWANCSLELLFNNLFLISMELIDKYAPYNKYIYVNDIGGFGLSEYEKT